MRTSKLKFFEQKIDVDVKLARGLVLAYFIYGLIYWLQEGAFLVPLPTVYYIVPFLGLVMFSRSYKWIFSPIFLMMPMLVLKDWLSNWPMVSMLAILLTLLTWVLWSATYFFRFGKSAKNQLILGTQISVIGFLFPIVQEVWWLQGLICLVLLVGATVLTRIDEIDREDLVYHQRVGVLIQVLSTLFLLQLFSHWQVSIV